MFHTPRREIVNGSPPNSFFTIIALNWGGKFPTSPGSVGSGYLPEKE